MKRDAFTLAAAFICGAVAGGVASRFFASPEIAPVATFFGALVGGDVGIYFCAPVIERRRFARARAALLEKQKVDVAARLKNEEKPAPLRKLNRRLSPYPKKIIG